MGHRLVASLAVIALVGTACSGSDDVAGDDISGDPPADTEPAGTELSGPGGVITIDGVPYPFEATGCLSLFGDILADGTGQTADGSTYFAGVSYVLNVRSGDLVPPEMSSDELAAAIAAGDIQEDVSVLLDIGREEILGDVVEDQPSFRAERVFGNDIEGSIETWRFVDGVVTGTGQVIDRNGVALPGGSTAPLEFVASCE